MNVLTYTSGTLTVNFPNGEVRCQWCPLMHREYGIRCACKYTGEILPYPESSIGTLCPIQFEEVKPDGNPCTDPW